jgi:mRNA interferase MazF
VKNPLRGEVVDIDLDPTRGSETGKVRPCVVVTNDIYNARVPVIQVVPLTAWTSKKARIRTNVEIEPSADSGLSKKGVADCLQTRPVDWRHRIVRTRGNLSVPTMRAIDEALRIVFGIH